MGSNRDYSPVGQTCPMINDVIGFLEYAHTIDDKDELKSQAIVFIDEMEKIRSANKELREWGNDLQKQVLNLEDSIEDLEKEMRYKDREIEDLNYELKQLSK